MNNTNQSIGDAKMTKKKPIQTIRRGSIEAAIWENKGEHGVAYNVTFSRSYKDGEEPKKSTSFGQRDLLAVGRLADLAEECIFSLRA